MYFLYSLLFAVGLLLYVPILAWASLGRGKRVGDLRQRLGLIEPLRTRRPVIWIHCVSVGETQAAQPLIRALREEYPDHEIAVSTVTATGQDTARALFAGQVSRIFYFPLDLPFAVRRALRAIAPHIVLIMETELWPRFLRECHFMGVPTALVNGRLSARSFARYQLVRWFFRRVVGNLSRAVMQTEADAQRIEALGLAAERVCVAGNIKFDVEPGTNIAQTARELAARFSLRDDLLIVAASTHRPEEGIVIEAFKRARRRYNARRPRLLIAPRHPERFEEVADMLARSGLAWTRRTRPPSAEDGRADAILLDTIGELRAVYELASLVFVGGSIAPAGGHNVLEPAAVGCPIIIGAHAFNFERIVGEFVAAKALVQLPETDIERAMDRLADEFASLLADEERRRSMGERARAMVERNRGAAARTLQALAPLLATRGDLRTSVARK
ncbi:MAG: 3-deoxy-D-manno-octulosonic acid transferase [Pyrinomonas sp.]|uniref:3-deoxy-D-manno-octulosonic acid transferase n=1 Tax=Pyrinomonas sp. TaxID=2080306 RepID=UPI00332BC746